MSQEGSADVIHSIISKAPTSTASDPAADRAVSPFHSVVIGTINIFHLTPSPTQPSSKEPEA